MSVVSVEGRDLRQGDVWQGDLILSIDELRVVPAKVLHESVAARHPEGLPGRTARLATRNGGRVSCTIFDDDLYEVERVGS